MILNYATYDFQRNISIYWINKTSFYLSILIFNDALRSLLRYLYDPANFCAHNGLVIVDWHGGEILSCIFGGPEKGRLFL